LNSEPIQQPSAQKQLLAKYVTAVLAAPSSLALTATHDPAEFWERHVLDALKILEIMPANSHKQPLRVIDVGSGNGIPGIPMAIALPNWSVTLLDSNNKKSGFLDMFCKINAIDNVHVVAQPAEVFAKEESARDQFDLGFARALGKLRTALELTLPFIKSGGRLMIPHGQTHKEELGHTAKVLKELRATFTGTIPYQLNRNISFTLLAFQKNHETPAKYPRRVGQAKKSPL